MRAPRLKVMCRSIGNRALLAMLLLLLAGCTSRYRLNLYLIQGETRSKIKVEKTEFITRAVLGDPMARDKLIPGDGNCLILITGSRGRSLDTEVQDLISYDRYTRYRVFLQLPPTVKAGSISLPDNSFVQMLGRYEVAALFRFARLAFLHGRSEQAVGEIIIKTELHPLDMPGPVSPGSHRVNHQVGARFEGKPSNAGSEGRE